MLIVLLSPREVEVLVRIARGLSNKLIAQELGLSVWTVKVYVHTIFVKLHVANRAVAAAEWVKRYGDGAE